MFGTRLRLDRLEQKELVREFAYDFPTPFIDHSAPMLPLWAAVLQSFTNLRRLHLISVSINLEKLLGLTKLQHLALRYCCLLDIFPASLSPNQARLQLQSLQLIDTIYSGDADQILLDVFVSPALTHLAVDGLGFYRVPWSSCTGLLELALIIVGRRTVESAEVITVLGPCIWLKELYLSGVRLREEHARRLQRLEKLQMVTCDVEVVEYLVPGRPVEDLRLHVTDLEGKPPEWQGHNWKAIIETIGESALAIKTLDTIDFRRCHPRYTLEVLDQLVGKFNALEELGLVLHPGQRENGNGIITIYIPPDVWLAITEAVRLRELADHRKRNKDTNNLPSWTKHVILNSGDLLRLSSVCRHARQALFSIALERLRVAPRKTKNKTRRIRMICNTARMLEILMEPDEAGHKELIQEFAFRCPSSWTARKHAPMLDLWTDVLRSLTNIRRLHLNSADIKAGELLELTQLQDLNLRRCIFNEADLESPPSSKPLLRLRSLQLFETQSDFGWGQDRVSLDLFDSSALTHLMVDQTGFKFVPWTACTGLHELVFAMLGRVTTPKDVISVLEPCISLKGLYLYGVRVEKEYAARLQKLERLQMVTCDVEAVEYLIPGRPVEHLRLHLTDVGGKPSEWQGHNWKTIIETIGESTMPIKTLNTIDFRRCQHTLEVLDQLVEKFNALEELGLIMQKQEGVIEAIPFVARLESLCKIRIETIEELSADPQDSFSWREAGLRDLVRLSKSKQLREVDLGRGHTWHWQEMKTWIYCGSKEDAPKHIDLR
ncbi:hypothetical protein FRC01_006909 [Tulasnella sp. 417]|nr:hypothetical protein FRC01_006909 [Tulasnella sp. 417]